MLFYEWNCIKVEKKTPNTKKQTSNNCFQKKQIVFCLRNFFFFPFFFNIPFTKIIAYQTTLLIINCIHQCFKSTMPVVLKTLFFFVRLHFIK